MGAVIKGIEYIFPENKYTNDDIRKDHSAYDIDRFQKKIGISTRYHVKEDETALDLAEKACQKLLQKHPDEKIDYILYCTQSPEYFLPTTACVLQDRLNLPTDIGALDFNLGCSGYVYGLQLAKSLLFSGDYENVLLVTAETYTKYIHENDVVNKALFGDAASATLVSLDEEDGIFKAVTKTDGSGYEKLIIKNGGTKNKFQFNPESKFYGKNEYTDNNLYMNGPDIFNFSIENVPNLCQEVLDKNEIELANVDYVIFHQANKFMLNFLRKMIKIPKDKFYIDLEDGGNTVSNTIPIALNRAIEQGKITKGSVVLLAGFGVGLSQGGIIIKL